MFLANNISRILVALLCLCFITEVSAQRARVINPHGDAVVKQATFILDTLEQTSDFDAASEQAQLLLDQVIAYASHNDPAAFREAAFHKRMIDQLRQAHSIHRVQMLQYLRANPRLARALAFAVKPENNISRVYAVLEHLREHRADRLENFANLAAAICVVHDRELVTRVNENMVRSPSPVELFDHFANNEQQMFFGIRNVPVELLVYVVDIGATPEEMQWALREYRGNRQVGQLFFKIRYDYQHFQQGTPKQITVRGFNLPNIRAFGGVCADQAHYAVTVGKAIGVPAVYTVGRSAEVGHAWVGYLQQQGRQGFWNFDNGRYDAYQGVRGVTLDPQTRKWVDDSYVSLLAELIGESVDDRHAAAALTDATKRLHELSLKASDDWIPEPLVKPSDNGTHQPSPARSLSMSDQLALLEVAMRTSHGYLTGWLFLAQLAETGQMSSAQMRSWADVVMRLCGSKYPDFAVAILRPMVRNLANVDQQNAIWERMFQAFRQRHDLAADIRIEQGQMWEAAGDYVKAGRCYEDVIKRYANVGPFVLDAVKRTEAMLHQSGKEDRVLRLYQQAWAGINPPSDMFLEFQQQSNWYQLGMMYAEKLQEMGLPSEAQQVHARIQQQVSRR